MKSICVMQPYVFPYLPYFQLASAVDEFWVMDDVQFIRRGWMNRNVILLNGRRQLITFPVANGARSDLINQKRLVPSFQNELARILNTAFHAYSKADHAERVLSLLKSLESPAHTRFLDLAMHSLELCFDCLGIDTPLYFTSSLNTPRKCLGQERIVSICQQTDAMRYVNLIGGLELYDEDRFLLDGIELRFIAGGQNPYKQVGTDTFVAGLSVLDLIANLGVRDSRKELSNYKLIRKDSCS